MNWRRKIDLLRGGLIFLILFAVGSSRLPSAEPDEALKAIVSFKSGAQSLEFCLRDLEVAVRAEYPGFAVKIVGDDLKLEGITRNMTIRDFEVKERPLAEVLTGLMIKADPNRAAAASDLRQKLIWVVGTDPADAKTPIILITTRAAAEKRGDKLPKAFQPAK